MPEFTIDTDESNEYLSQAARDAETHTLLALYRHLESKTLFQHVADELDWRRDYERQLEHEGQIEEIEDALGL